MKEYHITSNENEMELQFYFNKTSTVFYFLFFTAIFSVFFIFSRSGAVYNSWGTLLLMFCLFLYLTSEAYFEWKKYKVQKIKIVHDDVFINNENLYKTFNIKSVNVVYINSVSFGGWSVYLSTHYGKKDYTIKTRLKNKDAMEIANHIGKLLEKETIIEN